MEKYNFVNYVNEWWHYTLLNDLYPNTYFNFTIAPRVNSTTTTTATTPEEKLELF